jgi:hypothetical protein
VEKLNHGLSLRHQRTVVDFSADQAPNETEKHQGIATRMMAGMLYFALVFGSTFVIESLQELWILPSFGQKTADVVEMPLTLLALIFGARWVVDRFSLPPLPGVRLTVGCVAVLCWLATEFIILLPLRSLIADGYVATRAPTMDSIPIEQLGVIAAMPFLVSYRWEKERRPDRAR